MSSASAPRIAPTRHRTSSPHSARGLRGSYIGSLSSLRSRSSTSAPALSDASSARRSAPRLVEFSRSVPPILTTFKYPSLDAKSHHLQNACCRKVLLFGPESGVEVASYPIEQPSKYLPVFGAYAGERRLLCPPPAERDGFFEGPSLLGEVDAEAPGVRRVGPTLDEAAGF